MCENGYTGDGYCYCFLDDDHFTTWSYSNSDFGCNRWYYSDTMVESLNTISNNFNTLVADSANDATRAYTYHNKGDYFE